MEDWCEEIALWHRYRIPPRWAPNSFIELIGEPPLYGITRVGLYIGKANCGHVPDKLEHTLGNEVLLGPVRMFHSHSNLSRSLRSARG